MRQNFIIPLVIVGIIVAGLFGFWVFGQTRPKPETKTTQPTPAVETNMKIESTAFSHNGMIPQKYTCDGVNISPSLSFSDVPQDTKSLALIVDDPDAPAKVWVHWVVWNIAPQTREVEEGKLPGGAQEGITDFGREGWGGPCPSSGTHRYFFKLYALNTELMLSGTVSKESLLSAMEGHILAQGELVGLYSRQ